MPYDDTPLGRLRWTLQMAAQCIGYGHPSRRGKRWPDDGMARTIADNAIEGLARSGFTVTDRDGNVVVRGQPGMKIGPTLDYQGPAK